MCHFAKIMSRLGRIDVEGGKLFWKDYISVMPS